MSGSPLLVHLSSIFYINAVLPSTAGLPPYVALVQKTRPHKGAAWMGSNTSLDLLIFINFFLFSCQGAPAWDTPQKEKHYAISKIIEFYPAGSHV
jgi:hypothetical protein